MPAQITGHCDTHPFEIATGLCAHCGREACGSCLVRPFNNKRTICVKCALVTAGVRRSRVRPISRRERKRREREQREIVQTTESESVTTWVRTEELSAAEARAMAASHQRN